MNNTNAVESQNLKTPMADFTFAISTLIYVPGMGIGSPGAGTANRRCPIGSRCKDIVSAIAPAAAVTGGASILRIASGAGGGREGEEEEDVDWAACYIEDLMERNLYLVWTGLESMVFELACRFRLFRTHINQL
ncbi:hypothetical protein D9756_010736 [Leucocoprinus leucothites]|uniref:Uncharacterized protein n=1 Tax=Leucocoprinus leucothites TaxID=201217 RepID=A0A8H5CU93_9AGAR|nr:hypothetical protein D9756_010736 [Leucoagaricus leucothites]